MRGFTIIKKGNETILALLRSQKQSRMENCKLSSFLITTKIEDGTLYYSCLTGELILVNNINRAFDYMYEHLFFTERCHDEKKDINKIQHAVRLLNAQCKTAISTFEIATTTLCNANCFYCYEKGIRGSSMSKETAERIASFISKSQEQVKLRWFGGEPLLNTIPIDTISESLNATHTPFTSSIITNGFLFSSDIYRRIPLWKLNHATITIDGIEDTYNRIKSYKTTKKNPYRTVISNIESLIRLEVPVSIRINIERHNIAEISILSSELRNLFKGSKLIDFMFRPLINTKDNLKIESNNREIIFSTIIEEMKNVYLDGFNNAGVLPGGITGHCCQADSGTYLFIKPDGQIAFCSESIISPYENSKSDLDSYIIPDLSKDQYEKKDQCDSCPRYANCIPTRLCPAHKHTICSPEQKNYMLKEIELLMLQEYRKLKEL